VPWPDPGRSVVFSHAMVRKPASSVAMLCTAAGTAKRAMQRGSTIAFDSTHACGMLDEANACAGGPAPEQLGASQVFLSKVGEKLGDVESVVAPPPTAASAASAAPQAPPEINSILDAAKCGAYLSWRSDDALMYSNAPVECGLNRMSCLCPI